MILHQKGTLVVFEMIPILIMLIIIAIGLVFTFTGLPLPGWIIIIGVISFCVYAYLKGQNQQVKNEQEAKPLWEKLNIKKRELAEHQEIVSKHR